MDRAGVLRPSGRWFIRVAIAINVATYAIATTALAQYPANIDLGTLATPIGVKLNGSVPTQQSGYDVAGVGDLSGDGIDDLVIGSPYQSKPGGGEQAGAALVIYGASTLSSTSSMNAIQTNLAGYHLRGRQAFDYFGWSVSRIGDINLDGKDDFLVGAPNAESGVSFGNEGEAYVIYGRAAGTPNVVDMSTLTPSQGVRIRGALTDGKCGQSVAGIGDFDGDGRVDLAIGAPGVGSPTVRIPTPWDASDAAIGDVTGDGLVDIVSTHASPGLISISTGTGSGNFATGAGISVFVPFPETIELTDADLDGDLDLWIGGDNGLGTQCVVAELLNFGTGVFWFPTNLHVGYSEMVSMDVADADADGDPDLLVADNPAGVQFGQTTIVYGNHTAGVTGSVTLPVSGTAAMESAVFADLENDGLFETVIAEHVANTITVYSDLTGGNVAGQQFTTSPQPTVRVASDLDGDGDVDVGVFAPGIRPLINDGTGTMSLSASLSSNISYGASFGDFDGDQRLDVVDITQPSNRGLRVHRNAGNGVYESPMIFVLDLAMFRTRIGDLDADGRDDVVIIYPNQNLKRIGTALAMGEGAFSGEQEGAVYVVRGSSPALAAGDLNLSTMTFTDGLQLRGAYGGANFGASVDAAGDVNGDGKADLAIGMPGAHTKAIGGGDGYVVYGSSTLGSSGPIPLESLTSIERRIVHGTQIAGGLGTRAAGGADIDADGNSEVAFGAPYMKIGSTSDVGYTAVLRGPVVGGGEMDDVNLTGQNGFRVQSTGEERLGAAIGFGDVNDDGIADLLLGAPSANTPAIAAGRAYAIFGRIGLGSTGLVDHTTLPAGQSVRFNGAATIDRAGFAIDCAGDLNADGRDDIVIGAPLADPPVGIISGGITYLVHGKATPLGVDKTVMSLAVGGSQMLSLRAGAVYAGRQYVILGSFSGTTPGVQLGGSLLPLNIDAYTTIVATYLNSALFAGFFGVLDAQGNGSASFNLPPGIVGVPPHLLLNHAYLVLNAGQAPIYASNACPIYLDP